MKIITRSGYDQRFLEITFEHESTVIKVDYVLERNNEIKEILEIVDSLLTPLQSKFGEEEIRKEIFKRMGWEERQEAPDDRA